MARRFLAGTELTEIDCGDLFEGESYAPESTRAVGAFPGISPNGFPANPQTVKASPSTRDSIVNLDEVRAAFAETPYTWMVDTPNR